MVRANASLPGGSTTACRTWSSCASTRARADGRLAGCVATALGAVVYNPGDATVATHVGTVLGWVAERDPHPAESPTPGVDPPPPFRFETGDAQRDLLLHAAAEVTARSGVQHATLKRIGRVAGYVPSYVYSVYPSRDASRGGPCCPTKWTNGCCVRR